MKKFLFTIFIIFFLFLNNAFSQPEITVLDATVNFDTTRFGTSKILTCRVENTGDMPLVIYQVDSMALPFALQVGPPPDINLMPGEITTLQFKYTPPASVTNDSLWVYIKSSASDLSSALLFDGSQSMVTNNMSDGSTRMQAAHNAGLELLSAMFKMRNVASKGGVFQFGNGPAGYTFFGLSFSNDSTVLKGRVPAVPAPSAFGTWVYDGMMRTLNYLKLETNRRKFMMVLTDGADNSGQGAAEIQAVIDTAQANGITIFTIGIGTGLAPADLAILEKFADSTGGQFLNTNDPDALSDFYRNIPTMFNIQNQVLLKGRCNIDSFTLITNVGAGGGGTINGTSGKLKKDTTVTITAVPDSCHTFVNWTGDTATATNPLDVYMWKDKTITANFTPKTYTLTTPAPTGGVINGNVGNPFNCDAGPTLTAVPDVGYEFVNWTTSTGTVLGTNVNLPVKMYRDSTVKAVFQKIKYPLTTLTAGGTGTVTGNTGSPYDHGTDVTVVANPGVGYRFVKWTEGGADLALTDTLTVNMTSARTITAVFEILKYNLTTSSTTGGNVTGNSGLPYDHGTVVPLTANPDHCYKFDKWMEGVTDLGTTNPLNVTMDRAKNIKGYFSLNQYNLVTSPSPAAGGSVTGNTGSPYNCDSNIAITAVPNACYQFVKWMEGATDLGAANPYTVTMDRSKNIVAIFEKIQYALGTNSSPAAGGNVQGNNAAFYNCGDSVSLTPAPNPCYQFVKWKEGVTDLGSAVPFWVTMDRAKNITAEFELIKYPMTTNASPADKGTVTGNVGSPYNCGTVVPLTANPVECYEVVRWTDGVTDFGKDNPINITVNRALNITAVFDKIKYTLQTDVRPAGTGAVSNRGSSGSPFDCNTPATIVPNPNPCYRFVKWTEYGNDLSTDSILTIMMDKPRTITAVFEVIKNSLTTNATTGGSVQGNTGSPYLCNTNVPLTAAPDPGYKFVKWTDGTTDLGTDTTLSVIMDKSKNITAVFEKIQYPLTTTVIGGGSVTGAEGIPYNPGTIVTLTAVPTPGYRFIGWSDGTSSLGTDSTLSVTMDRARNVIAIFEQIKYPLKTTSNGGGIVLGNTDTSYATGTNVNLTAQPDACHDFVGWMEGDSVLSTDTALSVRMDRAKDIKAIFKIKNYSVTVSGFPLDGGTVSGTGKFDCDMLDSLIARPADCFQFSNWTENGAIVSAQNPLIFYVRGNRNIVANFVRQSYPLTTKVVPPGRGTIFGNDSVGYNCGSKVPLTAKPDSCSKFVQWNQGVNLFSTDSSILVNMGSATELTAVFEKLRYNIRADVSPFGSGTVTGIDSSLKDCGSNNVLSAAPSNCFRFSHWSENNKVIGSSNPLYIENLDRNRNIIANFVPSTVTLITTDTSIKGGTVTGNTIPNYNCNSSATITAKPEPCYEFVGWSENGNIISTANPLTITMDKDRKIIPVYKKVGLTLTTITEPPNSGDIKRDPENNLDCSNKTQLTATPRDCNKFDGWYENGVKISSDPTFDVTLIKDRNLVAKFLPLSYSVTTNVIPPPGGKITGAVPNYQCDSLLKVYYTENRCYKFVRWTYKMGGQTFTSTNNPLTFPVRGNYDITAEFTTKDNELITSTNIPNAGTLSRDPDQTSYNCDQPVKLEVKPEPCYIFKYWSDDTTNKTTPRTVIMDSSKHIQAVFEPKQVPLDLNSNIPNSGQFVVTPQKSSYDCGEKINITYVPNPCYSFVKWNNQNSPMGSSMEITIDSIGNFTAQVAKIEMNLPQIVTNNLPNVLVKFTIDSIINSNRYPIQPLTKNSLTVIDSSYCKDFTIIEDNKYTLDTKGSPNEILYDLGSKKYTRDCDTLRSATIVFNRNGCTIRQTIVYKIPLNFGCDSCGKILVKKDSTSYVLSKLSSNYPNPFNPSTMIKYIVTERSLVKLAVYDMLGRELAVIVNSYMEAGDYTVNFLPTDLPGGVYLYRLITPKYTEIKKMIYLK